MILLVTAHPHERKYITYQPQCGIDEMQNYKPEGVILFGCSGLLQDHLWVDDCEYWYPQLDQLYSPKMWVNGNHLNVMTDEIITRGIDFSGDGFSAPRPLHTKEDRLLINNVFPAAVVVDLETVKTGLLCREQGYKFQSVRYIIDRCDRKCAPTVINHFWRKWQHRRMQLKFQEVLNGLGA